MGTRLEQQKDKNACTWEDLPGSYCSSPLPTQGGAPPFTLSTPAHDRPPTANHGSSGGLVPTTAPPTVTCAHSSAGIPPAPTAQLLHQVQTPNTHCPQDPLPSAPLGQLQPQHIISPTLLLHLCTCLANPSLPNAALGQLAPEPAQRGAWEPTPPGWPHTCSQGGPSALLTASPPPPAPHPLTGSRGACSHLHLPLSLSPLHFLLALLRISLPTGSSAPLPRSPHLPHLAQSS